MDRAKTTPQSAGMLSDGAGLLKIPGNPNRHAIIVSVPAGVTAFVQVGGTDNGASGIQLNAQFPYLELTPDRYGDGVKADIRIQNAVAAAVTFGVVEFLLAQ